MVEKTAIIVGATSGIGLEVARVLASKGWTLGLAGRREERLVEIAKELPQVKCFRKIDITQPDATSILQGMIDELGDINLYFHSSGIGYQNPDLEEDKEMRTTETNVVGFTRMVTFMFHYFAEHSELNGHIAAISSIAGTMGLGAAPAYSSTKRYQSQYLECLQQLANMKKYNIHFTDIRPGFVTTDLLTDSYPMQLQATQVAKEIVYAIEHKKSVRIIDWKYRILVALWRLIPRCIWVKLKVATKKI